MRENMKKCLLYVLAGLMMLATPFTVSAEGTANYGFGCGGPYRKAPVAYEVEKVYHASDLEGVENLNELESMFVTDDSIYVGEERCLVYRRVKCFSLTACLCM